VTNILLHHKIYAGMGLADFYFILGCKNIFYNTGLDSLDFEYISANLQKWYSVLAVLQSLRKKKYVSDISSFIVMEDEKKTYTVRIKIKNIIKYIDLSYRLEKNNNNNDDIKWIENIAVEIITYLTHVFKGEYRTNNDTFRMFIYNSYPVTSIPEFHTLFTHYYSTTPRLWIRKENKKDIHRSRSQSSPPEFSPIIPSINTKKNTILLSDHKNRRSSYIGNNRICTNTKKTKPIDIPQHNK
jgi:hypothetical protein